MFSKVELIALLKKENDIDQKRNSKQPIMPMEENDPRKNGNAVLLLLMALLGAPLLGAKEVLTIRVLGGTKRKEKREVLYTIHMFQTKTTIIIIGTSRPNGFLLLVRSACNLPILFDTARHFTRTLSLKGRCSTMKILCCMWAQARLYPRPSH